MDLAPLRVGPRELLRRARFAYELALPRRYLFVMSHMRSYSSLLCHILNTNDDITGYVEMHRAYARDLDLVELALRVRESSGGQLRGRYIVDKVLHNYADVQPAILQRDDVYAVFMIREPDETIRSTVAMGLRRKKPDWKSNPDKVANYYVKRLARLVEVAQAKRRRSFFFEADHLVGNTEALLSALTGFLRLRQALTPEYRTAELTGTPLFGDPSEFIKAGTIVAEREDYRDIEIPPMALERSWDAFASARKRLRRLCARSIPDYRERRGPAVAVGVPRALERPSAAVRDERVVEGQEDRPVFVGACPRSGTTMLQAMLDMHPELAVPRESRFLLELFHSRWRFGDLSVTQNRKALVDEIVHREKSQFSRFTVPTEVAVGRMMDAPPTIGSVLGTAFVLYAEQHGKPRWGDKRPTYVAHHDEIFEMFPDVQFVNVLRDPRSSVASMKKLGWYKGSVAGGVEIWLRCVRAAQRAREVYRGDQFYELRYEDLVADPAEQLAQLCKFLGLDTAGVEAMLAFHERDEDRSQRYHPLLSQPVTDVAVRGWEQSLTPEEIAFVESQTREEMQRYGYEPTTAHDVEVPSELLTQLAKRRRKVQRKLADLDRPYPYPVAARLTSGQRRAVELAGE